MRSEWLSVENVSVHEKDWAKKLQPISARQAKRCENCGATGGLVFFRKCAPDWLVADSLSVKHGSPINTQFGHLSPFEDCARAGIPSIPNRDEYGYERQ